MRYNLSEITEVIKNRRTVYPENFSKRKVHKEIVQNLLNNAIWAPNHGLTQPWRFKVFQNQPLKDLIDFYAETYKKITPDFVEAKYEKFKARKEKSSVVIAIIAETDTNPKIPELEDIEAVACAVQNIQLSCTAYGLGSFWATGKPSYSDEIRDYLKLEINQKCLGFLYIGYVEGDWPKSRRKPIEYCTEWIEE
jgi:nitroreductase